jgi:hypothetical protein
MWRMSLSNSFSSSRCQCVWWYSKGDPRSLENFMETHKLKCSERRPCFFRNFRHESVRGLSRRLCGGCPYLILFHRQDVNAYGGTPLWRMSLSNSFSSSRCQCVWWYSKGDPRSFENFMETHNSSALREDHAFSEIFVYKESIGRSHLGIIWKPRQVEASCLSGIKAKGKGTKFLSHWLDCDSFASTVAWCGAIVVLDNDESN